MSFRIDPVPVSVPVPVPVPPGTARPSLETPAAMEVDEGARSQDHPGSGVTSFSLRARDEAVAEASVDEGIKGSDAGPGTEKEVGEPRTRRPEGTHGTYWEGGVGAHYRRLEDSYV